MSDELIQAKSEYLEVVRPYRANQAHTGLPNVYGVSQLILHFKSQWLFRIVNVIY